MRRIADVNCLFFRDASLAAFADSYCNEIEIVHSAGVPGADAHSVSTVVSCARDTGGWDFSGDGSLTKSTDHMQYKSSYTEAYLSTANKVDLTQISSITFDVEWVGSLPPSSRYFLGITKNKFSGSASAAICLNTTSRNQYSLDVKSIPGEYYIAGSISLEDGGSGYMNIYNIWGMPV